MPFDQVAGLASRRTYALTSSFRPTYNMAANLVARYPAEEAHHLLNLSFAQYRADRDVVALERQLERNRELLERQQAAARAAGGATSPSYRELLAARDTATRDRRGGRQIANAIDALRPGDVLTVRRGGGRAVVLKHEGSRGGSRVLAIGSSRDVFRLSPADFDRPPRPIATVPLPRPFAPRSAAFRRDVVAAMRSVRTSPDDARRRAGRPSATRIASRRSPSTRSRRARSCRCTSRPRVPSSGSSGTSRGWNAASGGGARAWPASSTGCCSSSSPGGTSTAGSSPPPATSWPASTRSATCCWPRRCASACSTGSTRPSSPRCSAASPTSTAAPRTGRSRPSAGRAAGWPSAAGRSSGSGGT